MSKLSLKVDHFLKLICQPTDLCSIRSYHLYKLMPKLKTLKVKLTFWVHFWEMTFSPCLEPYLIPCGETTVMVGIWGDQGPKNVKDMLNLSSADKPAISGIENSPEISRLTFWSESWMGIKITSWLFLFSKPLLTCLSTEPT